MRKNDGRASVTFLHQALEGKPLTVFGDGSQTRSLCYVDDLIRGLHLLALSDEHLPVNLGNPDHELTMLELAQACIRVTGSSSEIVFEALPIDDPMRAPARTSRVRGRSSAGSRRSTSRKACAAGSQALGYEPVERPPQLAEREQAPERPPLGRPGAPPSLERLEPLRVTPRRP